MNDGVMQAATFGALGPRDVILSCGLSGMAPARADPLDRPCSKLTDGLPLARVEESWSNRP